MNRSRYKNRYLKCPSRENFLAYKKARNLCNSLNIKGKETYFEKATENGYSQTFLLSKGFIYNDNISIENDHKIIEDEIWIS